MSYAADLWMRSDLRGMAGLDTQRRRPDSSSQLSTGPIPTTPTISLHLPNIWTRDRIQTASKDGAGGRVMRHFSGKTSSLPVLLNVSENTTIGMQSVSVLSICRNKLSWIHFDLLMPNQAIPGFEVCTSDEAPNSLPTTRNLNYCQYSWFSEDQFLRF